MTDLPPETLQAIAARLDARWLFSRSVGGQWMIYWRDDRVAELESFVREIEVPLKNDSWKNVMHNYSERARALLGKSALSPTPPATQGGAT